MLLKKATVCYLILVCCLLARSVSLGASTEALQMEKQEYKQDLNRIVLFRKSLVPGPTNKLENIEILADEIQRNWGQRNKRYYARLMLEVCGPLSSGRFNDDRQYMLAREYALLALREPNEIPIEIELKLIGHVMSNMVTPQGPKGDEWATQRRKDVEVRLHAWKRLTDAIDANWDPNDMPLRNVSPPPGTTLSAGGAPEHIKDLKLRAEYEAAIAKNRQKAERYNEQYKLRKWQKRFPKRAEEYIIQAYSKPPFDLAELKQYLNKYIIDEQVRNRIVDTVARSMQKESDQLP